MVWHYGQLFMSFFFFYHFILYYSVCVMLIAYNFQPDVLWLCVHNSFDRTKNLAIPTLGNERQLNGYGCSRILCVVQPITFYLLKKYYSYILLFIIFFHVPMYYTTVYSNKRCNATRDSHDRPPGWRKRFLFCHVHADKNLRRTEQRTAAPPVAVFLPVS